jgi:hypothetical protein
VSASDLRVSVAVSRLRCVAEPALVLAHPLGARLALALARVFELWVTRSLWHAIDNSELLARTVKAAGPEGAGRLPDARAVSEWITLRHGTDAGSWPMRWVGDCMAESQLQAAAEADLVDRFEWLRAALDRAAERDHAADLPAWCGALDLRAGTRDALALSAALDGAMLLCLCPHADEAPWPVQDLQQRGLSAACLTDAADAGLFAAERQWIRQALAGGGLAVLLQALPDLAVVHVLLDASAAPAGDDDGGPWIGAQTWWYRL